MSRNDFSATSGVAVAWERGVEPLVRLHEALLGHRLGTDAVAALDLVRPRDRLAGQAPRGRLAAGELRPEPLVAALVVEAQVARERLCLGGELRRRRRRLGLDLGRELRRPEVRVHEAVDVAAEPQPE